MRADFVPVNSQVRSTLAPLSRLAFAFSRWQPELSDRAI